MGKGIVAIAAMNLRNVPQRRGATLVVIIGIAGVVSVLLSFLAVAAGMQHVVTDSARPGRVIILSETAQSESDSSLPRSNALTVMEAPGLVHGPDGKTVASPEMLTVVPIPMPGSKFDRYLPLRGVGTEGARVRPELKIAEGRIFRPGLHEVIIGRMAHMRFGELGLGSHIRFEGGEWTVVGIFESSGDSHESELMGDVDTLLSAFRRNTFNSVTGLLDSPIALGRIKDFVAANPTLKMQVEAEPAYNARQSKSFRTTVTTVGYIIGGFMAFGAFFGAMNSLYSTVSARRVEIATLRAIGFSPVAVLVSVLAEAVLLALVGALLGTVLAWLLFDGNTLSSAGFSGSLQNAQAVFQVRLTFTSAFVGTVWAVALGLIGAAAPAWRAARLPIATALKRF